MIKSVFRILLLSLLLSSPVALNAQRSVVMQNLQSLKQSLEQGAEITFTAKTYAPSGELLQNDAGKLLSYKNKFRLTYSVFTSTYDGKTFSYYNKEEKTFTIMYPTTEDLATLNPLAYLSTAKEMYTIQELPESKKGRMVAFVPKKKSTNIDRVELCLSRDKGIPLELKTLFSDGVRMVMYIDLFTHKQSIPTQSFSQKHADYPGSELIDLR